MLWYKTIHFFSKAQWIAVIGIAVALLGVVVPLISFVIGNYKNERSIKEQEQFKLKARAYAELLGTIEQVFPKKDESLDSNSIRLLNKSLASVLLYAPAGIVFEVNNIFEKKVMDRSVVQELKLLLYSDLHNEKNYSDRKLETTDFPYFPFLER